MEASKLFGIYCDLTRELGRNKHARRRRNRHEAALSVILHVAWQGNPTQQQHLARTLAPMNLEQATTWIYANPDVIDRLAS